MGHTHCHCCAEQNEVVLVARTRRWLDAPPRIEGDVWLCVAAASMTEPAAEDGGLRENPSSSPAEGNNLHNWVYTTRSELCLRKYYYLHAPHPQI